MLTRTPPNIDAEGAILTPNISTNRIISAAIITRLLTGVNQGAVFRLDRIISEAAETCNRIPA
jgi:hypothetical protein